jgi:hypothetical protein
MCRGSRQGQNGKNCETLSAKSSERYREGTPAQRYREAWPHFGATLFPLSVHEDRQKTILGVTIFLTYLQQLQINTTIKVLNQWEVNIYKSDSESFQLFQLNTSSEIPRPRHDGYWRWTILAFLLSSPIQDTSTDSSLRQTPFVIQGYVYE